MYFWKTQQLADDIKNNKISEKGKMHYYLVMMVLFNIAASSSFLVEGVGAVNTTLAVSEMLLVIMVVIIGILITFKTNNGESGVDYIARATMLSLPIGVKIFAFTMMFDIVLFEAVYYYWDFDVLSDLFISLQVVLISMLLYWRINTHLKYINQS